MELPFWTPLLAPSPSSRKKTKTFGVVPRSCAHHIMEASDCVFELFGWRAVTRPVAKNRLPYFVPKTPGYTLLCQLPFSFPCSADHEREWPPCKVVFFGLATNTLNVRTDFSLNNKF